MHSQTEYKDTLIIKKCILFMLRDHKIENKLKEFATKDKIGVLFVCLGNICRSPAAQGVFESKIGNNVRTRFNVDSAGTGSYHIGDLPDSRMRVHARKRGYNLTHRARQFKTTDFDDFDLIVVMDESNCRNVISMARTNEDLEKIVPMGVFLSDNSHYDYIPDPYYEGSEGFELVLDLLEDATENLFTVLTKKD